MPLAAQSLPELLRPFTWLQRFLKEELSPYPGRTEIVARMVLASTLVMVACMTFHIPYAAFGAIYALLITRESFRATVQLGVGILSYMAVSVSYILISVQFVISSPLLHFLWVLATFFVAFYVISTAANYSASASFAVIVAVSVPLWDSHVSAETNVEKTLWLTLAVLFGIGITAAVELVFLRFRPGDEIVLPIGERLAAVESLMACYADGHATGDKIIQSVLRLAIRGTSDLRRTLWNSGYTPQYKAQMSSVVALVGRLVDVSATLTELGLRPTEADRKQLRSLAANLAILRGALVHRQIPMPLNSKLEGAASAGMPLLQEMTNTVTLIYQALADSNSEERDEPLTDGDAPTSKVFRADALANPKHIQFALKGCCAATACYILYTLIDWPGISTAVTTCLVTALSTIGTSRQKQVLRFGGAIVGGFLIGTGSQIFILPYVDSIVGFTVFFIVVVALASWFMTSSPRLSYFGLQIASAFCLLNLQEFAFQTSLSIARDRVVGILLGLFMMWLVFDRLWSAPAAVQMKKNFIFVLRLLAQFEREPLSKDLRVASDRSYSLRETISNTFDQVRALGDAVLFEFGPSRQECLSLRSQVISLQSRLRVLFVMRLALWKYRAQLPGFELPGDALSAQHAFDNRLAQKFDDLADKMEGKALARDATLRDSVDQFERRIRTCYSEEPNRVLRAHLETFLYLYRETDKLLRFLEIGIAV